MATHGALLFSKVKISRRDLAKIGSFIFLIKVQLISAFWQDNR